MARPTARVLQMADALRDQIAEHAAENPEDWLEVPAVIARGVRLNYMQGPYPAVVVSVESLSPTGGGLSDAGIVERVDSTLKVYGITRSDEDTEGAVLELEADLFRAIDANRQLTGSDGEPVVECGYVKWGGSQIGYEPGDIPGLGVCEITVTLDHGRAGSTA